jgi:hypothetical protein
MVGMSLEEFEQFALIENNQRVFGADNAGDKWHWHPAENPDSHVPVKVDVTFEEFLARLESELKR